MKLKTIVIVGLSVLSLNVFAQEGNIETNAVVNFKPAAHKLRSSDYSTTMTENASGSVGQTIKIKTYHSFSVKNDSNQTKNYLVAETCEVDGKKYKKGWGFTLAPHDSKGFSENAYLDYPANRTGSWKIESMTCVANSSACSFDHATLTVN